MDGQQAPENMLNVDNHKKNANQNHNEVSLHTCQNGYCQKTTNKKCWGFGEKETFVHYWWECKLIKPLWKTVWSFFRKQKMELLWKVKVLVAQSYLALCDPMDCSSPGSSVRGISQARILEWVAISFSRGSSWPRDFTQVSRIAGRFFTLWVCTAYLHQIYPGH